MVYSLKNAIQFEFQIPLVYNITIAINIQKIVTQKMAFPTGTSTTADTDKYQGVVIAEVACTLILFIVLRIIYFCMWGYHLQSKNEDKQAKESAETDDRKWDQDSWDIYFPIIFGNHIIALALPILYTPSVFTCVLAFIHFALFCAILIVNIFLKDAEPGQESFGDVTLVIIFIVMCLVNTILVITGLAGIRSVLAY